MINNFGAETRIHYAPSTKFYLADKQSGKPWITKIPFPVHIVERVDTYDHISRNRFVTHYAYHHRYFDGVEREFRGFGMVELWDTEEYFALSQNQDFPTGKNIEQSSHVPPTLTRTWFHTGAHRSGNQISFQFRNEYYHQPELADDKVDTLLLSHTILTPNLSPEEERLAYRALRGVILRHRLYVLDRSTKTDHPYTVSERNYIIKTLQPIKTGQDAVFLVVEAAIFYYRGVKLKKFIKKIRRKFNIINIKSV